MSADKTRILAELGELLRPLSDNLLPGEEITTETKLGADLGLESIALANMSGRMQARYGPAANIVPFLAAREAGPLADISAGEVADFIATVLDQAETEGTHTQYSLPGRDEDLLRYATDVTRMVLLDEELPLAEAEQRAAGHQPANDNEAVLAEAAPGVTRKLLQFPSGQVEVFVAGQGAPLVLMHPVNVGAGLFARQFAALTDRYQVICMHNPGVGATTWNADVTLAGIARLYRAVLAELAVAPPFHVMGCSFGGIIAQEFALAHRTECASLVVAGGSYRAGARSEGPRPLASLIEEEFGLMYAEGAGHRPLADRDELAALLLRCESMDPRLGLSYVEGFRHRPSQYVRLPDLTVPTLIVRGELDTMIPAEDVNVLVQGIPDARAEQIAGAGHFPCLTHPEAVSALLVPFLASHGGEVRPAGATMLTGAGSANGQPAGPQVGRCVIIGTGRCGSTMLSDLITHEEQTLSVSESLSPIRGRLLVQPLNVFTGAQYWAMLSQPGSRHGHLLTRIGLTGRQYSYPDDGRYAIDKTRVPPILRIAIPKLTDNPDWLFDMLAVRVPRFPAQPVGQHHKMLLDLMTELMGRRRWVERTGASSMVAFPWLSAVPDAKVVYLTRNTADTARSMSKHPVFQMSAVRHLFHTHYGTDPYVSVLERSVPEDLPDDMRRLLPENLTAETLRGLEYDLGFYENMIAQMNGSAEQALADLHPKDLYRVRYEDILADPVPQLTRLGEFIGFADPAGWAGTVASQVLKGGLKAPPTKQPA